jgi:preprotein translocase subunit SecA
MRARTLRNEGIREEVLDLLDDILEDSVQAVCDEKAKPIEWNLEQLTERFKFLTGKDLSFPSDLELSPQAIFDFVREQGHALYHDHAERQSGKLAGLSEIGVSPQLNRGAIEDGTKIGFEFIEQDTVLEAVDYFWRHHLQEMDYLREGIGLRGWAQKNPLYEYQREGFILFQSMLAEMKESVIRRLMYHDVPSVEQVVAHIEEEKRKHAEREKQMQLVHGSDVESAEEGAAADPSAGGQRLPDDERARLEAQRKARRKASKR